MISAVPPDLPVTLPLEETVATAVLELLQVTPVLSASVGLTVAVAWVVPPMAMVLLPKVVK
jgi:hypothetical protein